MHKLTLGLSILAGLAGCTTTERKPQLQARDPYSLDRLSTHGRLQEGQSQIESRARSYEAEGRSAKEARALAEAEYLRSSAGSPSRP